MQMGMMAAGSDDREGRDPDARGEWTRHLEFLEEFDDGVLAEVRRQLKEWARSKLRKMGRQQGLYASVLFCCSGELADARGHAARNGSGNV